MALTPNTQLGRYEIRSQIGAGGMGEVYRANDPKINRDVAIKVLPSEFSADSDRLRRFEQEAQAAGALNHPNILAIHDVDMHDGAPYVVSELLEGQTLREGLNGTALPTRKAIAYALQIAHGLAAAHGMGIVHRDLKPENLFVTTDGRVKILDFGIAKLVEPVNGVEPQTDLPTRRLNTDPGAVIGTVGYMSPEQVRGQRVDHRSDIFAFGCVFYEMLSGRRTFRGESAVETLNAILKEDPPDLSTTNSQINPALERVVKHCLEKNPEQRFQSARDLAFALDALSGSTGASTPGVDSVALLRPPRSKLRERIPWLVAALAVMVAALTLATTYFRRAPAGEQAIRLSISPPEKTTFRGSMSVSPDGRRVALRGNTEGKILLWVRPLDSLTAQPLSGTDEATHPFWSPDSRFIGFSAGGKLKRIDASGGPAQTLCDASVGRGGTWNRDGVILFVPKSADAIHRVPAAGGTPIPATTLDASREETAHTFPYFLPDGKHFLFLVNSKRAEHSGVYVGSLDWKETKRLLASDTQAAYSPPGYILFGRGQTLLAQGFDARTLETTGEPATVAEVGRSLDSSASFFSVSQTGVLVYRSGGSSENQLAWFDRGGKQLEEAGPRGDYSNPRVSPDGKRVAFRGFDPQSGVPDIWLFDVARNTGARFTFDPANANYPVWSPDGSRIAFASERDGPANLYQKMASGAGGYEPLLKSDTPKNPTDWSADGRFLLYASQHPKTGSDLWILPLSGDRQPVPFLQTDATEGHGQFSPDGRWVAYNSNETGTYQVYVQSFPGPGGKWQVSTVGGVEPRWGRDGKELFYMSLDRKLMAVEVRRDSATFEAGAPKELFQMRLTSTTLNGRTGYYDVSGDGERFLINSLAEGAGSAQINVVLNWTAELKR